MLIESQFFCHDLQVPPLRLDSAIYIPVFLATNRLSRRTDREQANYVEIDRTSGYGECIETRRPSSETHQVLSWRSRGCLV